MCGVRCSQRLAPWLCPARRTDCLVLYVISRNLLYSPVCGVVHCSRVRACPPFSVHNPPFHRVAQPADFPPVPRGCDAVPRFPVSHSDGLHVMWYWRGPWLRGILQIPHVFTGAVCLSAVTPHAWYVAATPTAHRLYLVIVHVFTAQGTRPLITPAVGKEKAVFGDYAWKTYGEVWAEVQAIGSAIVGLELAPPSDDPKPVRRCGDGETPACCTIACHHVCVACRCGWWACFLRTARNG